MAGPPMSMFSTASASVATNPAASRQEAGVSRRRSQVASVIPGEYAEAMKQVGAEKKVPVVDLHTSSWALVEPLGSKGSADMASAPGDGTHFNGKGAKAMAELVMKELPAAAPALQSHLKGK